MTPNKAEQITEEQLSGIYLSCGIFTRQCTDEEQQGLLYKVKFAQKTFPSVTCCQSDIEPTGGKQRGEEESEIGKTGEA